MDALAAAVSNGLAKAAEKELGSIAEIKRRLKSAGALAAEMSGSGSACFGIFETLAQARRLSAIWPSAMRARALVIRNKCDIIII